MSAAVLAPPKGPPPAPRRVRFTRAQYFDMAALGYFDGKRVERIRGEIVEMSAVNWPHALSKMNTADGLRAAFAGVGWVSEENPLALPVTDSDPEPDVAVYPGHRQNFTDHPTAAHALLVVEVAESSLFHDTTTKAELYAEDAVREYWIVDLVNRQLLVLGDPAPIAAGGHAYRTQLVFGSTDSVTPLAAPNATLRVADLLP